MFKSARRAGLAGSAVQVPVAVHAAGAAQHVDRDELLQFVGAFVAEKEAAITVGGGGEEVDATLGGALAQLKRFERDLKGLAPAALDA
ncbi:hypothetical protein HG536_0C01200 [Torulaspora globosa]|uniref:Uncharacterized protein n=1 Tax=Torulaspora globosa TaxID=48254 RepID=A0A7G3ZEL6_9SACH|nr:uncharacterized protein HG536_0C01200 [Torulaspora globosa]QLL31952.1 hypothetical protein HG536_0C01200 [Torulaspora globosa]